ncbi:hypothetical protein ACFVU3_12250 [Streptomyces sp. NPDC058052]|uniref:hypothetical protein n=1 Tax=Streptomyces sp. NPDC058052 TaxID=3346316 RepID=UPI0036EF4425
MPFASAFLTEEFTMRSSVLALAVCGVLAAPLATAAPAAAATTATALPGPWEPAPSPSWSYPAGVRCDFAVHGGPVVDEVVRRTLATYEDGTLVVEYKGTLVVRVTHSGTGASYDADASGHAVVVLRPDRSQRWYVTGPILAGFGEGGGNVARGLYTVDGTYTLDVSPTGYKTLDLLRGTTEPLCAEVA